MTKEELKIKIDDKYSFYEELVSQGVSVTVLGVLERQLQRMMDKYNEMD